MTCLDPNTIGDFLSGALPPEQLARATAHLDQCEDCRALIASMMSRSMSLHRSADLPAAELAAGTRIDHYEVIELVGQGAMGDVYLANDIYLDRQVAIKLIWASGWDWEEEGLFEEAKTIVKTHHPNIITVYGVGMFQGAPYIALEYVKGGTLRQRIEGELGSAEALQHAVEIARALTQAHAKGIVHGDLKPENILLTHGGQIKVVDFGLSHFLQHSRETVLRDTASEKKPGEMISGTPAYMAPEQWKMRNDRPSIDIWAFGVIFSELLTGKRPSTTLSPQAQDDAPVVPPTVQRSWGSTYKPILQACLKQDPTQRPTAETLVGLCQRALRRETRSFFARTWPLWLVLLITLGVAGFSLYSERRAGRERAFAAKQRAIARQSRAAAAYEAAIVAMKKDDLLEARRQTFTSLHHADSLDARFLWDELDQNPVLGQKKLSSAIVSLAHSPDGRLLAAGCQEGPLYVLDSATHEIKATFQKVSSRILSLAFSPDGALLASTSLYGTLRLWNVEKQTFRVLQAGGLSGSWSLAYSRDGKYLAAGGRDHKVRLWTTSRNGAWASRVLEGHQGIVRAVRFSPAGDVLASGSDDKTIRIWTLTTGAAEALPREHKGEIRDVAFHPRGHILASADALGRVILWNWATKRRIGELDLKTEVSSVHFSFDGTLLATGSRDQRARIWKTSSLELLREVDLKRGAVNAVRFHPQKNLLVAGNVGKMLALIKATATTHRARGRSRHDRAVYGASFHPSGKWVASASADHQVLVWDVKHGRVVRSLRGTESKVWAVAFHPDGKTLASGGMDGNVTLWDWAMARQQGVLVGHEGPIHDVRYSPDGKLLATSGADQTVRLWSTDSGATVQTFRGHQAYVWAVSFDPTGRWLASTSSDLTLRFWPLAGNKGSVRSFRHPRTACGASFGSNDLIATGCDDGWLRIFDLKTRRERKLRKHSVRVHRVAFDPSGTTIAAPSADHTTTIWDIKRDKGFVLKQNGHTDQVNSAVFGPDANLLLTTGNDKTVRLWRRGNDAQGPTWRPAWRAPYFSPKQRELFTQRGWQRFVDGSWRPIPSTQQKHAWRRAVAQRGLRAAAADEMLCLYTMQGTLELWDKTQARKTGAISIDPPRGLWATGRGCYWVDDEGLGFFSRSGKRQRVHKATPCLAATRHDNTLLYTTPTAVYQLHPRRTLLREPDVRALAMDGGQIALADGKGRVKVILLEKNGGKTRSEFATSEIISGTITHLALGPMDTLFVGTSDGAVAIVSAKNGKLLFNAKTHGAVRHLWLDRRLLYVVTELGGVLVKDVGFVGDGYCKVLTRLREAALLNSWTERPKSHPRCSQQ